MSCAVQGPARTIEPDGPSKKDDAEFVIAREGAIDDEVRARLMAEFPIHLQDSWWPFRGEHLGLGEAAARERDAQISFAAAPADFWDQQTAVEAVSVWISLCNECHGGRRRMKDALSMPLPPRNWGQGSGLFFGKRRPYSEIFALITNGGPERNGKPSEMPSWQGKLSREQIWSMIYFLEYQSGGIEGTFPPSLYPRGPDEAP